MDRDRNSRNRISGNRITGDLWGNAVQAQHIHGDVTFNTRHRWWLTALAVVIAVGAATLAGYWINRPGEEGKALAGPPPPKLVSQVNYYGCGKQYLEGDPKDADVERLKLGKDPTIVHTTASLLRLDVYAQNPSPQEILLLDLRVEVRTRTSPPTSGYIASPGGCGSVLKPRFFEADLTKETVTPEPGEQGEPAVGFPYQVSQGDPELFRLYFVELTDYVEFLVVLDVVVEGRQYEIRLDNEGRFYKVTGQGDLPQYGLNNQGDGLVPSS